MVLSHLVNVKLKKKQTKLRFSWIFHCVISHIMRINTIIARQYRNTMQEKINVENIRKITMLRPLLVLFEFARKISIKYCIITFILVAEAEAATTAAVIQAPSTSTLASAFSIHADHNTIKINARSMQSA